MYSLWRSEPTKRTGIWNVSVIILRKRLSHDVVECLRVVHLICMWSLWVCTLATVTVKCDQGQGQMWPWSRSNVTRVKVKCDPVSQNGSYFDFTIFVYIDTSGKYTECCLIAYLNEACLCYKKINVSWLGLVVRRSLGWWAESTQIRLLRFGSAFSSKDSPQIIVMVCWA